MAKYMADNDIKGRVALITGASGGIGSAIAYKLASEGVHLSLHYNSSQEKVNAIKEAIGKTNPTLNVTIHQGNLGSADDCLRVCKEAIEQHGKVDILVSNAGYGKRITNIWDIPVEEFDYMININLRASFALVKGVVEGMRDRKWGRIIFISSIAAYGGGINGCHYAASKAGLAGMMRNLSARLAEFNISINDVSPAMVEETGMLPNAASVPGVVEQVPLGRLCQPSEVANAVYMYTTTGFVTGQSLVMSGGLK